MHGTWNFSYPKNVIGSVPMASRRLPGVPMLLGVTDAIGGPSPERAVLLQM